MSKQHAAGFYLDGRNVVLGSHRLNLTLLRFVGNQRTRSSGVHRIEQTDGDIGILGRLDAGRVQNLGTEVCQLGGLFEMQMTHRRSLVHNTGVVVVHAVDIRPNLDFGSVDGSTNQRSRIVASATLQIVYLAVGVAADVPLSDINLSIRMQFQLNLELVLDIDRIGLGILVRTHVF